MTERSRRVSQRHIINSSDFPAMIVSLIGRIQRLEEQAGVQISDDDRAVVEAVADKLEGLQTRIEDRDIASTDIADQSGKLTSEVLSSAPEEVRRTFEEYSRENIPFGMAFADLNAHWWPLKQRQVNDNHADGPLTDQELIKEFNLMTAMEWARKRLEVVAA